MLYSSKGTSEVVMRSQFRAWREYMAPALQTDSTAEAEVTPQPEGTATQEA